jgi:hypothetical protein
MLPSALLFKSGWMQPANAFVGESRIRERPMRSHAGAASIEFQAPCMADL